jgi:hypothetical protein
MSPDRHAGHERLPECQLIEPCVGLRFHPVAIWNTLYVSQIDPDDDSRRRWVLRWYRYDPDRMERRQTVVAAYTRKHEFRLHWEELAELIERRKASGESEDREYVCGGLVPRGYRKEINKIRAEDRERRARQRGQL